MYWEGDQRGDRDRSVDLVEPAGLARRGLVHRVGDAADGRSYVIELTDEGHRERARFRADLTRRFARHLEGWPDEEVATFAAQLSRLVTSLADDVVDTPARARTRNPWRH